MLMFHLCGDFRSFAGDVVLLAIKVLLSAELQCKIGFVYVPEKQFK